MVLFGKKSKQLLFLTLPLLGSISFKKISKPFVSVVKESSKVINIFDNFHKVEKNKLYRSKQLSAKKLGYYIRKYRIKTVVNLRGEHPGEKWWEKEKNEVNKNGANFLNISLSASRLPTREEVVKMLDIYESAQYPILVHCRAGADRTGLFCALYMLCHKDVSRKKALKQLSKKYLHFKSKFPNMDRFVKMWVNKHWLLNVYDPDSL